MGLKGNKMIKRLLTVFVCVAAALMFTLGSADAKPRKRYKAHQPAAVQVHIDIGSQTMSVRVNGLPYAYWRVSTARAGYYTPRGSYSVKRMAKVYYSRKYDNSPMPNSVFFHGGYAIHGTGYIKNLGRPASHGCVRLHPSNAARLFSLVQRYGMSRTRITLTN
jgi:lipoprotein-anchoring transpeptidase ErfK/SrfK